MMCGLEIHQRLVGRKLFCSCIPNDGNGGSEKFTRRLHTVRSELGEVDSTAKAEATRSRTFLYNAPLHSTCLVESDEEPPHPLSPSALHAALTICSLLSSRPVDELYVMRKSVIDGSNTSGFQRTAVAGLGGAIQTPSGPLPLQAICIEEESAGIMEAKDGSAQYDLSRLGIPLVEIATFPDLRSGKEAQEAALAIGKLLRKTGMVSRGIGTIRQDLNISIPEGARVEIKGVQDLSLIALTVDLEVQRQEKLISVLNEAKSRLSGKPVPESIFDITDTFSSTQCQMVSKALKGKARVLALPLPKYAGLLGIEISPNRRFGSELADYARAFGVRGLVHSDESMEKYGFSVDEISELRMALSLKQEDAFLLVVAEEKKARAALSAAFGRAMNFSIIEETRRASPDGTSSYMRPLPGRARMYPETDVAPILITKEMLADATEAASSILATEEETASALSSLNAELAAQLSAAKGLLTHSPAHKSRAPTPELSAYLAALEDGIDGKLAASAITNTLQSLKREGTGTRTLDEERLLAALAACQEGVFAKAAMQGVLREMCRDASATPQSAATSLSLQKITGSALAALIEREKLDLAGLMAKYRLRVDATEASEIIKKKKK
ncbi:MAG: Glu-tRNA(Gln) amidotransferase subunit GatE [Candidatus Micrarchaeota archaeon]|nr:Glu-tRNA(Gln) amidotransferase subunit GatE [Candidatus Micrarchaeota archaeon]